MNYKSFLALPALSLLVLASYSPAGAHPPPDRNGKSCISIGGTISAAMVGPAGSQAIVGSLTGTLSGAVQGIIGAATQTGDGLEVQVEDHIVTDEGFVLQTADVVKLVPVPGLDNVFHQSTRFEVISGTGKFARANGSFTSHGEADLARGTIVSRYEGRICGME